LIDRKKITRGLLFKIFRFEVSRTKMRKSAWGEK
jgi:hypothetical protein